MLIKLTSKAVWDTEAVHQSEEALAWLQEKRTTEADLFERDEFGRPKRWTWDLGEAELIIENIYIYQSTNWSLKDKTVTIKQK